jgi:hypothetical protein
VSQLSGVTSLVVGGGLPVPPGLVIVESLPFGFRPPAIPLPLFNRAGAQTIEAHLLVRISTPESIAAPDRWASDAG